MTYAEVEATVHYLLYKSDSSRLDGCLWKTENKDFYCGICHVPLRCRGSAVPPDSAPDAVKRSAGLVGLLIAWHSAVAGEPENVAGSCWIALGAVVGKPPVIIIAAVRCARSRRFRHIVLPLATSHSVGTHVAAANSKMGVAQDR